MNDAQVKDAAVNLVLQSQTDHKIMTEMLRRVVNILQNPVITGELFRYKMGELKRAIEQVKVHL
jgi:hypothetical protein